MICGIPGPACAAVGLTAVDSSPFRSKAADKSCLVAVDCFLIYGGQDAHKDA